MPVARELIKVMLPVQKGERSRDIKLFWRRKVFA